MNSKDSYDLILLFERKQGLALVECSGEKSIGILPVLTGIS